MKTRNTILRVEILEDRCVPTTYGNPWPDASHLTLSFVPDGTPVGSHTSNLFDSLNALAPTKTWQSEILRAFQAWAVQGNINLSVVADDGSPLGTAGALQNDARFGDIRVAAWASALGEEAVATPFEMAAGTWSGDVQINSSIAFSVAGSAGAYDLFSVMVHEAGHVFGFDHNADPSSVMYEDYVGVRAALGAGDVGNVQRLYGRRAADSFEGAGGNQTLNTATHLSPLAGADGSLALTAAADLATLEDKDVYSFNTLLNLGAVDLTVRTAGISLLAPRATVFDAAGRVVTRAVSTDPVQGGFVIHLTNVRPLSTYYIQIDAGRGDVFGVGSYELTIRHMGFINSLLGGVTATVNFGLNAVTNVLINNDLHTNDSFTTATSFPPLKSGPAATYAASYRGSISDSSDVDFFKLQTPVDISGDVFTVMVWGLQSKLDARVRVFDAQRNLVSASVLVNDGFSYVIEIAGAAPQATYYIEVLAANSAGADNVGNYFVGAYFTPHGAVLRDYVSGTLTSAQPSLVTNLTIHQKQLFHFVLSADAGGTTTSAKVQMTITDASGKVVFTLTAGTTEAASGDVALDAGTFTVRFTVLSASGSPPPSLAFRLRGNNLTDPIGPESTDPTEDPGSSPDTSSPPPATWWSGGDSTGVPPQDPSTNPSSGSNTTSDGSNTPPETTTTSSTTSTSTDSTNYGPTATAT